MNVEIERIRIAKLVINTWAGRLEQQCYVIGETPKKYRISAFQHTRLGGRNRVLGPGETALVPKSAIRFFEETRSDQYRDEGGHAH